MRQTVSFTRDSANVFFHLLTRCNLRCRHCYINPDQHGHQTLDIDTIGRWLEIFARRHPSANLILLGGEPTLHPDLATAVKQARHLGYGSVTIDTNGYLFHDIINRVTPAEVDFSASAWTVRRWRSMMPCAVKAVSRPARPVSPRPNREGSP